MILNIAILLFVVMEISNLMIMYFKPDFKYGNSMASFVGWSDAKSDEKTHLFAKYLVTWVANCKLIFIILLLVIVALGDETIKVWGVGATILSIGIYFISLHPIIKKLDQMGEIRPKGYSKTLGMMIAGFMIMFSLALMLHFFWPGL